MGLPSGEATSAKPCTTPCETNSRSAPTKTTNAPRTPNETNPPNSKNEQNPQNQADSNKTQSECHWASAPGQSESDKVRGLTPPGSPKKDGGWHGWPAEAPPPAIAPFDAEQAKHHQEAWAKYLGVPVEHTNSLGMKFRLIPPGEFTMGSTAAEIEEALKFIDPNNEHGQELIKSEAPQHKVILTQPIYLGVHEVTQADYEKVMGNNPSWFAATGPGKDQVAGMDTTNQPVEW